MLTRWVNTGRRGSQGRIYREVIDDIETPNFAEEYDNTYLGNVTKEGLEAISDL